MPIQSDTTTLPAHWALAIVNGDYSTLSSDDCRAMMEALKPLAAKGWSVVGIASNECECDASDGLGEHQDWCPAAVEQEPRFTWHYGLYGGAAAGGFVLDYIIHREIREEPL